MTAYVNEGQLRDLDGFDELRSFVRMLGFNESPTPHDVTEELPQAREAEVMQHGARRSSGYVVLLAELDEQPRSFQKLGRHLLVDVHDRPLVFCGVRGDDGRWRELVVLRPRWLVREQDSRRHEVLSVPRLTIDLDTPTAHDRYILNELVWHPGDDADGGKKAQERIDTAFDTERVTKRFFSGLRKHHDRLLDAVRAACQDPDVKKGVEDAGGAERVALRLLTQVLFSYFLQRKGLFEDDRHWLTARCREAVKQGQSVHETVLEPLFYEALAKPPEKRPDSWRDVDVPFLNGGLFERLYGPVSLPILNEVLDHREGLVGFLDTWTFTVAEEAPGEPEVAVDPEMLGKVFESLLSDEEKQKHGVVYTPRPVVRFMCREALVPQLQRHLTLTEELARALVIDDHADEEIVSRYGREGASDLFERLDHLLAELTVLDPAVGSGAFLLGMLTEILRLRAMAYRQRHNAEPDYTLRHNWKLQAVQRSLFGVDIEAGAVEICMLRLWLSLVIDAPGDPEPLPNLDYRVVCADSLVDYVNGVPVQFTRERGTSDLGEVRADLDQLTELRARYFDQADPDAKQELRDELHAEEDRVVHDLLARAKEAAGNKEQRDELDHLAERFASQDRRLPVFMPAFTNPEIWGQGGWDVVAMNPPYRERKKVRGDFTARYVADLEAHYGRTMDLLAHFGMRAFDYTREGGTIAVIANDSWFTSTDAVDMRLHLFSTERRVRALARTRCFEGVAVNGGVFVAERAQATPADDVRWVENHGREPQEMLGASIPAAARRESYTVEGSELWVVPLGEYRRLPHRPAFRPNPEARELLARYEDCVGWDKEFSVLFSSRDRSRLGWGMLPQTDTLLKRQDKYRETGFYEDLTPGQFLLAGLAIQGGQGLSTADDRRFLAVLDGTPEAEQGDVPSSV